MKAPRQLTRKLGPLPVYGWAALAIVAFVLYRHYAAGSASSGTPVTPNVGSAAQRPASGQGTAADNAGGDLLSALGANADAANALLAAVQRGGLGFGVGAGPGTGDGAGAGTDTAATTAPTVLTNDTNTGGVSTVPIDPATGVAVQPTMIVTPGNEGTAPSWTNSPTAGITKSGGGYYTPQPAIPANTGYFMLNPVVTPPLSQSVAAPTPTVVQPAPVQLPGRMLDI